MKLLFKNKINYYKAIKLFICLNPILITLFLYLSGFIDYNGYFQTGDYVSIAKVWLNFLNENHLNYEIPMTRLTLYPLFVSIIFIIFGVDNYIALIFIQAILGSLTFYFLIKVLERLNISKNILILLTLIFNLNILYRFTIFLPDCLFIFLITIFIYNFTEFYYLKKTKNFYFMCFCLFLLMLTSPILLLSFFFTIPLLILILFKKKIINSLKMKLCIILIFSYISPLSIQFIRHYNQTQDIAYTTHSGLQLIYLVLPCLSKKFGCGTRDMEVYTYLSSKFEDSHDNISHNDVTKDRLAWNIGIEYFINNMDKSTAAFSAFFSYVKLFIHSSLIEIYPSVNIEIKNFSEIKGETFIEKIVNLFKKCITEKKYFFYFIAIFFIILLRLIQIVGILSVYKNYKIDYYLLVLVSLIIVILIPAIGIGSPTHRSELEVILIIFGAIGIERLFKKKIKCLN